MLLVFSVSQYNKETTPTVFPQLWPVDYCIRIIWNAWLMQIPGPTDHLNHKIWHHFHHASSEWFWLPPDNSDFLASSKPQCSTKIEEGKMSVLLSSDTSGTPHHQSLNYNTAPLSSVVPTPPCTWESPVKLLKLLIPRSIS